MSSRSARIRVLSVDDHPALRLGIAALLANQPDLDLVGQASNGEEAIEQFRSLRPDVTLMDVQMPRRDGIDVIAAIRSEFSDARIVVLTTYAGDALAQRALRAGAQAYILKNAVRKELVDVIRAVHSGQKRVQAEVAVELATHAGEPVLTPRELRVLELLSAGNSNQGIADALLIEEETVKRHVASILSKLGARGRTHAVTIALRRGILQL